MNAWAEIAFPVARMKTNGRSVALAGVLTALSLLFMYLSFAIQAFSTTFNIALTLCVVVALFLDAKAAPYLIYVATSVLGAIIVNFAFVLPYICFFGLFPIIWFWLSKMNNKVVPIIVKLVYFNGVAAVIYFFTTAITNARILEYLDGKVIYYFIYTAVCTIVLFVFDYCLTKFSPMLKGYLGKFTHPVPPQ